MPPYWPATVRVKVVTARGTTPKKGHNQFTYVKPPVRSTSTVAAKNGVVRIPGKAITAIAKTDAGWAVTVNRFTPTPTVGAKAFASPDRSTPAGSPLTGVLGGWVTKVTTAKSTATITIAAIPLDQLLAKYKVNYSGPVTQSSSTNPSSRARVRYGSSESGSSTTPIDFGAMAAKYVTCTATHGGKVDVSGSAGIAFKNVNSTFSVDVLGRHLEAHMSMEPTLTLDFSVSGSATCSLNGSKFTYSTQLGASPLRLDVTPEASFTIDARAHLHAVLSSHAQTWGHLLPNGKVDFSTTFQPMAPQLTGSASANLTDSYIGAQFNLYPEVQVAGFVANLRLHLQGAVKVTAATTGANATASSCYTAKSFLKEQAWAYLKTWWTEWDTQQFTATQVLFNAPEKCVTTAALPAEAVSPPDVTKNSVIRTANNGVVTGYVVDDQRVLHKIPFAQDDTCWRDLKRYPVSSTGLSSASIAPLTVANPWPCIIGPAVVKASDGSSYYVDTANLRHAIPDTDTYAVLARQNAGKVYGPWPKSDVNAIPPGNAEPHMYNPILHSIVRRSDGVSWVVDDRGVWHHIPYAQDDTCWRLVKNYAVSATGLTATRLGTIDEGDAWPCIIGNAVVKGGDGSSWYVDTKNTKHSIPDTDTFYAYQHIYGTALGPWSTKDLDSVPTGRPVPHKFNATPNTIIRRADGVSWVIGAHEVRHHIPYAQDDVCWRDLRKYPVSATNLTSSDVASLSEGDAWPCIIGNRVVKSSDGSSWYVDRTNTRHWIPDTDTYAALVRRYGAASGPWPATDVSQIPKGADNPHLFNAQPNSIIRRADGVSWIVDASGTRHHIPYIQDDVCWRDMKKYPVSATNLSAANVNTLPEGDAWPCIIGPAVVKSSDGSSYFVDAANTRHWIPDTATYAVLARKYAKVLGPWPAKDVASLPKGPDQIKLINPQPGTIIRRSDGVSYVVGPDYDLHHIPYAQDDVCFRDVQNRTVSATGLSNAQIGALTEHEAWPCVIGNAVVKSSNGSSWFVDRTNTRHWIPDTDTYAVMVRKYGTVYGPWAAADVNAIPKGSDTTAVVNPTPGTIIRRSDGISYVVGSDHVLHHIPYAQDDVCWRDVRGYTVSRTRLSASQTGPPLVEGSAWPCIIGDAVVKASDGTSYYVDTKNARHWIPDGATFAVLARQYPVYGPWSTSDAYAIPKASDLTAVINPQPGKLIKDSSGVSWKVDSSYVLHRVPSFADEVCWRDKAGLPWQARGVDPKALGWPNKSDKHGSCSIGNSIVKSTDGSSWVVDGSNTRRWIPDGETYVQLNKTYTTVYSWPSGDVNGLPKGADEPHMIDPNSVRDTIACNANGNCYYVDGNAQAHWIPDYPTQFCTQYVQGKRISRTGLRTDQIQSLGAEGGHWGCGMDAIAFYGNTGADYVWSGGQRHWIPDRLSWDCYSEMSPGGGRPAPQSDLNRLSEGSHATPCLPRYKIRGHVITMNDQWNDAYYIDGNGVWHHITNTWNCVTQRHSVYATKVNWSQAEAPGHNVYNEDKTSPATCSM